MTTTYAPTAEQRVLLEPLLAYAEAFFAATEADRDSLYTLVFAIDPDGASRPLASTRDKPAWPHTCGRTAVDHCPRCAPDIFGRIAPPPRIDLAFAAPAGVVFAGLPIAVLTRFHLRATPLIVAPRHPFERDPTGVGWQVREYGARSIVTMLGWDRTATWDALVALACALSDAGRHVGLGGSHYWRPEAEDEAALDAALRAHTGDISGPGSAIRRAHERALVVAARAIFEAHPRAQSVMIDLGQYYSDQAYDEVHGAIYASERSVPTWPHWCTRNWDDPEAEAVPNGELCRGCAQLPQFDPDYGSAPIGLGPHCVEGASQDEDESRSHRPYAIVRRGSDAVEIVGPRRRSGEVIGLVGDGADPPPWPEGARALLAHGRDASARSVLADYLIERGDPRGERIAHGELAMLDPLGRVIVPDGADVERGLLVGAVVHCESDDLAREIAGAVAWTTVESLRYLPGSAAVLDEQMWSLRELLLAPDGDALTLVGSTSAWPIEVLYPTGDLALWAAIPAAQLPVLRHVIVPRGAVLVELATAAWWPAVARVTLIDRHLAAPDPSLAGKIVEHCTRDDLHRPAGWMVTTFPDARVEISLANFHPNATRETLRAVVDGVRQSTTAPIVLVSSRYFVPAEGDLA